MIKSIIDKYLDYQYDKLIEDFLTVSLELGKFQKALDSTIYYKDEDIDTVNFVSYVRRKVDSLTKKKNKIIRKLTNNSSS